MSTYHAYFTVFLFIIMVGVILWAYSSKRQSSFEEAANLPFSNADIDTNNADSDKVDQLPNTANFSQSSRQDQGARS